jgi:hypothetical protein
VFIGRNAKEEGKKRRNSGISGAIGMVSSHGLVMRLTLAWAALLPPRNILTKGGGYTISHPKE